MLWESYTLQAVIILYHILYRQYKRVLYTVRKNKNQLKPVNYGFIQFK